MSGRKDVTNRSRSNRIPSPWRERHLCAADPNCVANAVLQHPLFPTHSIYPGNEFGSIGQEASFGNSNYNSLQVSVNKAPTHGLSFLVSYTYAHSLDIASSFENADVSGTSLGTNPFNPRE